jgi:hypothetical protein
MAMGRPQKTEARVSVHTYLPAATAVRMKLYLTSEAAGGKIPNSATQVFLTRLINEFFEHKDGVRKNLPRSELERVADLLGAIRDLANHPKASKEAFAAIAHFSREAMALLTNSKEPT